jgi:hypothetical protein
MVTDDNGILLAIRLTGGNVPDTQEFKNLLDELPRFRNSHGRRTWKPDKTHADKGYASAKNRFACFRRKDKSENSAPRQRVK